MSCWAFLNKSAIFWILIVGCVPQKPPSSSGSTLAAKATPSNEKKNDPDASPAANDNSTRATGSSSSPGSSPSPTQQPGPKYTLIQVYSCVRPAVGWEFAASAANTDLCPSRLLGPGVAIFRAVSCPNGQSPDTTLTPIYTMQRYYAPNQRYGSINNIAERPTYEAQEWMWVGPEQFCLFKTQLPNTLPVTRYASQKSLGRIYILGTPPNAFYQDVAMKWADPAILGYAYPN